MGQRERVEAEKQNGMTSFSTCVCTGTFSASFPATQISRQIVLCQVATDEHDNFTLQCSRKWQQMDFEQACLAHALNTLKVQLL